jgi:hypothetical protein
MYSGRLFKFLFGLHVTSPGSDSTSLLLFICRTHLAIRVIVTNIDEVKYFHVMQVVSITTAVLRENTNNDSIFLEK